ncbi:MAG: TlpA family protein disulfide reductase [Actinomycetota bacterium]
MSSPSSHDTGSVRRNLRRRLWAAAVGGVIVAGIILLAAGQRTDSPNPDVVLDVPGEYQQPGISTNAPLQGTPLQHSILVDLDDVSVSTSDWFTPTGKPMLVNFWFTSCPPCRREMPALQQAFETYGEQVRFVGVNVQDSASAIRSFADELGVTYEMLRDINGKLVVANGITAFPTTLFIDSSGRIVKQVAGELMTESIDRSIAQLLPSPSD